jgi:hypothetical protein
MDPGKGFKILLVGEGGKVKNQTRYMFVPVQNNSHVANDDLTSDQIREQIIASYTPKRKGRK